MDSVQRNIVATQNLLRALEQDASLLDDDAFMQRLSILRAKHEQTTWLLAARCADPPTPSNSSHCHRQLKHQDQHQHQGHDDVTDVYDDGYGDDYSDPWAQQQRQSLATRSSSTTTMRTFVVAREHAVPIPIRREYDDFATTSHVVEEQYYDDMSVDGAGRGPPHVPPFNDDFNDGYDDDDYIRSLGMAAKKPNQHANGRETSNSMQKPLRSKSMTQLAEFRALERNPPKIEHFVPQITVPQPFKMTTRKSIPNTYAKKFLGQMLEAKQLNESEQELELNKKQFKAHVVPSTTYVSSNPLVNDTKYVEAMRRKVAAIAQKRFQQTALQRSRSEGSLAAPKKKLGYVPTTTYVSPIPRRPYERGRDSSRRAVELLTEATTPPGIKAHASTSNRNFGTRHSRCRVAKPATLAVRRASPPNFGRLHRQMGENLRRVSPKPATVVVPFNFATPPSRARHRNCATTTSPSPARTPQLRAKSATRAPVVVLSTHAAQLREELNRVKVKEAKEQAARSDLWNADSRHRVAAFLGSRSRTSEEIAVRTKEKLKEQQEVSRGYMRQLAEMKQRVLNGPLIMERQSALAQEHRFQRRFEQRLSAAQKRSANPPPASQRKPLQRHESDASNATFVASFGRNLKANGYDDDFDDEDARQSDGNKSSKSSSQRSSGLNSSLASPSKSSSSSSKSSGSTR